ncbi:MFS transporter [Komagataeibacter sp. FNDCF1]|uniref:MFS transporter n=1 Tax=Komagataeibacter sp. FNDCF1 TaxID=2878681 RepID=UPI001E4C4275|nr:MFS transporter [Komagataeibacter sp. FNDCF1]
MSELPRGRLHAMVAFSAVGGMFCDGYVIGGIGAVMPFVHDTLHADAMGSGMVGSGTLFGLLCGAFVIGQAADRFGRKPLLQSGMMLTIVFSLAQGLVTSVMQLALLRFALGVALAADYVAGNVYQIEFSPLAARGRRLSTMLVGWTFGFALSFQLGYLWCAPGGSGWRWCLMFSALPAMLVYGVRMRLPESLSWLLTKERHDDVAVIIRRHFPGYQVRAVPTARPERRHKWGGLATAPVPRRMVVAFVFLTAQLVPFFGIGTFLLQILGALGIHSAYLGGMIYAVFIIIGSLAGRAIVDRLSRPAFLSGTFLISSFVLFVLASGHPFAPEIQILLLAVFALVLSAACCMQYVYMAELFPVAVRASCNGLVQTVTRLCVSLCTLLLPIMARDFGTDRVLQVSAVLLGLGGLYCLVFAPDTRTAE